MTAVGRLFAALTVGLATLALGWLPPPGRAGACDDPIFTAARKQELRRYGLIAAWQPGAQGVEALDETIKKAQADWLTRRVNLDYLKLDMSGAIDQGQFRPVLARMGVYGYPFLAVLGAEGEPMATFALLADARKRLPESGGPATQPAADAGWSTSFKMDLPGPVERVVIFYDSELSANDTAGQDPLPTEKLAKQWAEQIAAEPLVGQRQADLVDVRRPGADRKLVESMKLRPLPVCLLMSPEMDALEISDRMPTDEQLRAMALSPVRDQLAGQLANEQTAMALLFIYGTDVQANADALAACRKATRQAAGLFKVDIPLIELDPADPREAGLVKVMGYTPQAQAAAVPVIGKGKMIQPVLGPIKSGEMLDHIQMGFHPGGCESDTPNIGQDLLLGPGGGPWPKFDSAMAQAVSRAKPSQLVADEEDRELAAIGFDPKLWWGVGGLALALLALVGGAVLLAKARMRPA